MSITNISLETCVTVARVLARREEFFVKKPGNTENLKAFNKNKLGLHVYEIFSDNKYYHQDTTRHVPSRKRKAMLHMVQRSEAVAGAIKILGRGPALDEFINVINGSRPWLTLNRDQLVRITPDFNFDHFQNFANITSNLKVYDGLLARHQRLNATQCEYIKEQLDVIKKSAAALCILISNPLVLQLTNDRLDHKKSIAQTLKVISEPGELRKISKLRELIHNIQSVHEALGFVFSPDLLKPNGVGFARRRALASASLATLQPAATLRADAPTPTTRGAIRKRRKPTKHQRREIAGQTGLAFGQA